MSNLLNVFLKISHKTMQFNELQTVLGGEGIYNTSIAWFGMIFHAMKQSYQKLTP